MIVWIIALIGVGIGVSVARKRGGSRADMAQYGFGYGVAFLLGSWIISLLIFQML